MGQCWSIHIATSLSVRFGFILTRIVFMWSRSAGGAFGKMEAAHEEQYFRQLVNSPISLFWKLTVKNHPWKRVGLLDCLPACLPICLLACVPTCPLARMPAPMWLTDDRHFVFNSIFFYCILASPTNTGTEGEACRHYGPSQTGDCTPWRGHQAS